METLRFFFYVLPARVGSRLAWLPPLAARVAVGWTFMLTGWGKLADLGPVIEFFRELGIPAPELQAPFVAGVELGCGTLLLLGLATRVAALPLIGTMVVAIATAQWAQVEGLGDLVGLVEFLYIVFFAWLAVDGPGPVSLDALVGGSTARARGDAAAPAPGLAGPAAVSA